MGLHREELRSQLQPRARRRDGAHDESVRFCDGHDAVDRGLDLGVVRPVGESEREREVARAHDEAVDTGHRRQLLDTLERLARLDLGQDQRLVVRAKDPVLLPFAPQQKPVRAHRREAAEAGLRSASFLPGTISS